jgi:glutamyl-Q tRNA(Asp) synthetase
VFWCQCSRKSLAGHAVYPGNCRQQSTPIEESAIRLKVTESDDTFDDKYQGLQTAHLGRDFGDVILKRRDHLFAYQLAVVTDDIQQNISHVIRGIDLMSSTFWQRDLYRAFNAPCPSYGHFPVLYTQSSDQKLSKQNLAPAVNEQEAIANLQAVFNLLHLSVATDTPQRMLHEALSLWQPHKLYNKQRLHISEIGLD